MPTLFTPKTQTHALGLMRFSDNVDPTEVDIPRPKGTRYKPSMNDTPEIINLMLLSIAENMKTSLTTAEMTAAQKTMGVDYGRIDDRTYFGV